VNRKMAEIKKREDFVALLKRSKDVVGYLQPVIVDADTYEIVDGKHRKEADLGWPEERRKFKGPKEKLLYKIVSNNMRRTVSKKERQSQLLELALHFEDESVPREKMASKISEETGFSLRYVERLLPKKYKETRFAPKRTKVYVDLGRPQTSPTSQPTSQTSEPVVPKPSEAEAGFEPAKPEVVETEKIRAAETSVPVPEPSKPKPPKPKTVVCPYCKEPITQLVCSYCLVGKISVKDLFKDFSNLEDAETEIDAGASNHSCRQSRK
jgi:hypothetical protein